MTANARRGDVFFPVMGLVLLALAIVVLGFVVIGAYARPDWSIAGVALFAAAMLAKLVIAGSAGWATFVEGLFG